MPRYEQSYVMQNIRQEFQNLGYVGNLLQEDYAYADVLGTDAEYVVRRVPLAAFCQDPPSYRTAAFGVTIANGHCGSEFIRNLRSLGSPQILEVGDDEVHRWKVTVKDKPVLLDSVRLSDLPGLFAHHKEEWTPQKVLRAKADFIPATQLDFLDLGLLPLLDNEVRTKLDRLLQNTVSLAIDTFERKSPFLEERYPSLFRLVFRLIASKVLADRNHPGHWDTEDPGFAIESIEEFYFKEDKPEPVLEDYETQNAIWEHIRNTFHFQNLSVDSLAYVYENTLVTRNTRKSFGIHSTPPVIAEYIVRQLPFHELSLAERRVFEPFSGHSVFLVAAMQRLRDLLPSNMSPKERHNYFVEMLSGIEIDAFAREVARLSLMLADYPNPDGWKLYQGDALKSPLFEKELERANIVLCNPPFGRFDADEKVEYENLSSVWKPAEILHRVLQNPPELLGFVLPKIFLNGQSYKQARSLIGHTYSSVEILGLPDRVFQHSEAESVLLISSGLNSGSVYLQTGEIHRRDLDAFYTARQPWYDDVRKVENAGKAFADNLWRPPLDEVWQATAEMKRLGDLSRIHRGIQYNIPFVENRTDLVAFKDCQGFMRGLHTAKGAVEPYIVTASVFLNMDPSLMLTAANEFAWEKPKLIVNASRQSRGPWEISASVDYTGLVCYRNFHGIWPTSGLPLELLAAIMNGPMANAFVSARGGNRYIRISALKDIPVPEFTAKQQQDIVSLVCQYINVRESWSRKKNSAIEERNRCLDLLHVIDAEILKAYDLEPRLERTLLDYFNGYSRLGPVEFTGYFPPAFKPFIPWHLYISEDFKKANVKETLKRLPVIPKSPVIDEVLSHLD
ncbi:MAG: N-6 DNA methylase [Caldilineaceae bacterium]|nr:N-6 DNA methylase [Caldilineaceae bacterium]